MNKTLFTYIFVKQLKAFLFVSFSVFLIIGLFDFVEVSRRFPISSVSEFCYDLQLTFLRVPITFCEILHYIYFIAATFSLWDLCRSHQVTIMKSAGRSPQQILFPFIIFSCVVALSWLFAFQPLGILSEQAYQRKIHPEEVSSFEKNENIWIDYGNNKKVAFIKSIFKNSFQNFCITDWENHSEIIAESGEMKDDTLVLKNVSLFQNNKCKNYDVYTVSQNMSSELLKLLSLPAIRQDIYALSKIFQIEKNHNLSLRVYELAFHKLLANFATFILFALLAAVICFPINRYKTKTNIALQMLFISLLLKFSNNLLESFAYTVTMSVTLAAWATTLFLLLIAIAILVWKEA